MRQKIFGRERCDGDVSARMFRFVGVGVQVAFLIVAIGSGCISESKPELASVPDSATGEAIRGSESGGEGNPDGAQEGRVAEVVRVRVIRNSGLEAIEGDVEWTQGMTVFAVLNGFSPSLEVSSTGQGESLFVKSIAGQENLGSAGDNWIYRVNGQLGDRSCGVYSVSPGDEVVWSFGKYQ